MELLEKQNAELKAEIGSLKKHETSGTEGRC